MAESTTGPTPRRTPVAEGDLLRFDCPRCGNDTLQERYGPCAATCVPALRSSVGRDASGEAELEAFVPAAHVTVNAVALKDD